MKTHIKKIAVTGFLSLVLLLPRYGNAQDSTQAPPPDDQQYENPTDNPPNANDQQLDQQEAPPTTEPVTTQTFYDQLAPYGQWVNYGDYGYVWIPSAVPNFSPYSTEGHWVYTTYGWTWVSDYPWGWACFHYGRWSYDNNYGWFWVPGTEWGPAWVAWRHSDGYYGWAPLCPGIDITVGYGWDSRIPVNSWCFVNDRYIGDRHVWQHYEPRGNNGNFIRNTTLITNTYYDRGRGITYSAGPQREEVERNLHTTIRPVPVHESAQPEQRYDQAHLHLYRPNVTAPAANVHPAPARATTIQQVPQRNVQYPQQNRNFQQQPAPAQRQQMQPQREQAQPQRQQQAAPQQRSAPAPSRGGNGGGGNRGGGRR